MANTLKIKRSSVENKVPQVNDLELGELALNTFDGKLYTKKNDGTEAIVLLGGGTAGAGDVVGPASATDNAIARYDGTTGKLIQNGLVTIDDNGNVANVNSIGFDTTPATLPTGEGTMYWDADKGAVSYVMQGGDVTQEIGESQYMYIHASANITKGQVVMFTGAIGGSGIPTGAPASGVTDGSYIMGIAAEDITSGTSGFVQTFGVLKPIDTNAFATDDILWYDPSVTGGLTKTKPSAPNVKVQVAAVTAGGSSGGAILIRVTAGSELGATDSNVLFGSLASGNLLVYNATAGYWVNANLTAGTGVSVTNGAGSVTVANTDRGSSQNIFKNVAVSGQSTIVADSNDDTLTVAAGTGISLTTNATTDTLTIASTNNGTVTSIETNNGITGGTITSTGTIGLTGQALALHNLATNGLIARTGSGTVAGRTLTASTGISITNGDGVSGNPTITNTAPDQVVSLTGSGATTVTGTYPNFTISSTDTNTTYGIATSTVPGLVEVFSDTDQSVAANAVTATAGRTYGIQLNSANQMVVNVPWTDTNTTYSAGNGIGLSGTTFSVAAGTGLTQDASGLSMTAITAGGSTVGAVRYNGTTNTAGQFYGGTTNPSATTRLNYAGNLHVTNLTAVTNVTSSSDERLKKDWAPLDGDFVYKLAQVKSGTYTRTDIGQRQAGVSAQSFQTLLAEVVSTDENGMLSVAYGQAALVSAVELSKQIVKLQEEVKQLKEKLNELK